MNPKKIFTKKKVTGAAALLVAIAIIVTGTFAYTDFTQHRTAELGNSNLEYEAILIENFIEEKNWKTTNNSGIVTKEISVKNAGNDENVYGDVYVRLQLKEYMEMTSVRYQTTERYMLDSDGNYIHFATSAEALVAYPGHTVVEYTEAISGVKAFYVQTKEKDNNGQYGRKLTYIPDGTTPSGGSLVAGVVRASDDAKTSSNHNTNPNGECNYTVHTWADGEGVSAVFRDWVSFNQGDRVMYTGATAIAGIPEWDGTAVEAWIIDTDSTEGWVYWGAPIAAGEETSNLLDSVQLLQDPSGTFYYAVHADMEAVDISELVEDDDIRLRITPTRQQWADAPAALISEFVEDAVAKKMQKEMEASIPEVVAPAPSKQSTEFSMTSPVGTLWTGEVYQSVVAFADPTQEAGANLTYASSNIATLTIDADGEITAVAPGTSTITITVTDGSVKTYSRTVANQPTVAPTNQLDRISTTAQTVPGGTGKFLSPDFLIANGSSLVTNVISTEWTAQSDVATGATLTSEGFFQAGSIAGTVNCEITVTAYTVTGGVYETYTKTAIIPVVILPAPVVETIPLTAYTGNWRDVVPATTYAGGDGTKETPFLISSMGQLKKLTIDLDVLGATEASFGKYFKLTTDLDFSNTIVTECMIMNFYGSFDGGGHVFKNLTIDAANGYASIFYIFGYGELKNFGREGGSSKGNGAYNSGLVIVLNNGAKMMNCFNSANIEGTTKISGLVYSMRDNTVMKDCYNTGNVTATSAFAAGLICYPGASTLTITNCYNTGTISGVNSVAGLITTLNDWGVGSNLFMTNCYNYGDIRAISNGFSGTASIVGKQANTAIATPVTFTFKNVFSKPNVVTDGAGLASGRWIDGDSSSRRAMAVTIMAANPTCGENALYTDAYGQSTTFAIKMGSAFKYKEGSFPVLSWQQ